MGRLIVISQMTIDGVTDQFDKWFEPDWDNPVGAASLYQFLAADALILGRKNYEGFAAVWPQLTDPRRFCGPDQLDATVR